MSATTAPPHVQKGMKSPRPEHMHLNVKRQRNKAGLNAIRRIITPLATLQVHFTHTIEERPHADTIMVLSTCKTIVDDALENVCVQFKKSGYVEVEEMIREHVAKAEKVRVDRSQHAGSRGRNNCLSEPPV